MARLNVNGKTVTVDAEPATPLLWVLRENLGLTGTKYGCGIAACGAGMVLGGGKPAYACRRTLAAAGGAPVVTIEAMSTDRVGCAVQDAWVRNDVVQCGYCQSGQVMAATALLKAKRNPTDRDIDEAMSANLCRCGTYQRIRAAVKDAAKALG
ncbi:MAG: (2Fe-2S)-binding protein [Betaproteobacteria bacterium]